MKEDIVKFVQKRLWSAGHRTKRMPEGMGFDLMVDGKIKTVVVDDKFEDDVYYEAVDWKKKEINIIAIVGENMARNKTVFYMNCKKEIKNNFNEALKGGVK